jgi:hypothetical protein
MNELFANIIRIAPLLIWLLLCGIGGFWITRALFRLHPNEELLVGVSIGLVTSTFLVNFLGRIFIFPAACWLAAGILLVGGFILMVLEFHNDYDKYFKVQIDPWVWIIFVVAIAIFVGIGSGMGILDEYAVLPLVSQISLGDIPPHFGLDPKVVYNYHYFPYLFSAQLMNLGNIYPWTALDLQQALFLALCMFLLGLWVYRITRNQWVGIGSALFYLFSGGTRWLMLFFPAGLVNLIDRNLERMGTGLYSGETLRIALASPWAARGTGPYLIPYAFANGFNESTTIGLGFTNHAFLFLVLILLTFNRIRNWKTILIYPVLLAILELSNEITFVILASSLIIIACLFVFNHKSFKFPKELLILLISMFLGGSIVLFHGGVISGVFEQWVTRILNNNTVVSSFHAISVSLALPPAFVDVHFGVLSLTNPIHLLVWLIEVGPMVFLLGPALLWGIKAFRADRWFEAILACMIIISLILVFISMDFKSSSLSALTRVHNNFLLSLKIFAIPIVFLWFLKNNKKTTMIISFLLLVTVFGGFVIFGIEMLAMQKPILSVNIDPLDAKIMDNFFNKLDTNYNVFDPEPIRDPVIFGHPTNAGLTWYVFKPEWNQFFDNPNPVNLLNAGYGYIYTDQDYVLSLPEIVTNSWKESCVKVLADYKDNHGAERILMDIRDCK